MPPHWRGRVHRRRAAGSRVRRTSHRRPAARSHWPYRCPALARYLCSANPRRRTGYAGEEDPDRDLDADTSPSGDVLQLGEEFIYTFDLGDNWRHRCLLADTVIDPDEVLGVVPGRPLPYWGWGVIPDAYGRLWDGDDGQTPVPAPPHQPWPWPDPPPGIITTAHRPGQY